MGIQCEDIDTNNEAPDVLDVEMEGVEDIDESSRPRRVRNIETSTPFGFNRLTPRFDRGASSSSTSVATIAYQATCLGCGHKDCNKSISHSVSGSEDLTLRMLKLWLLKQTEPFCISKEAHKAYWPEVVAASCDGTLPSNEELDASMRSRMLAAHPASSDLGNG